MARQTVTVEGLILKNNSRDYGFDGAIQLQIFKTYQTKSHVIEHRSQDSLVTYKIWGDFIFSGQTAVKDGKFAQTFVVPTKISYDEARAKLAAFAWKSDYAVAFGAKDGIYTGGTEESGDIDDAQGPQILFAIGNDSLDGRAQNRRVEIAIGGL